MIDIKDMHITNGHAAAFHPSMLPPGVTTAHSAPSDARHGHVRRPQLRVRVLASREAQSHHLVSTYPGGVQRPAHAEG